ncbi:MAG: hypothetical protein A3D28_06265 [Omnitrophica bacterium RIFCSPHIGHO2_02_FULL_63_14]|nr:MAG: hypothetical protein A3D28_06265 [Omnitrophica bacterium RIFCSPHIGHO2_02_FULL_63_14]
MPSVLVIGASGMLGSQVFLEARRRHGAAAHGTYRMPRARLAPSAQLHRVDLENTGPIASLVRRLEPSALINCAGIVRGICADERQATAINTELPHYLERLADETGARLIHVSTDCVFSGKKGDYRETDTPDPTDLYSRTKLSGEVRGTRHLTVRSSFIGFELETRRGLLEWFLAQKGRVRGFRGAVWSGLTTPALARLLLDLAARGEVSDLLHVSGERLSKYDLLTRLARVFKKTDVTIEPVDEPRVDMSLNAEWLGSLGVRVPPMDAMLEELGKAA